MTFFFHFSCKMQSDLRRHREFHNAVLAHHCDFEGCNFSARAMQTVKRHQKVDHQVGSLSNITNRYQWIARCFVFFLSFICWNSTWTSRNSTRASILKVFKKQGTVNLVLRGTVFVLLLLYFSVHMNLFISTMYMSRELICTDMNVMSVGSDTLEDLGWPTI